MFPSHLSTHPLFRLAQLKDEVDRLEFEQTTLHMYDADLTDGVAATRCRQFADMFYTILPLELRDMVYAYCWDEESMQKCFNIFCTTPKSKLTARYFELRTSRKFPFREVKMPPWSRENSCAISDAPFPLDVWMPPQYVGIEVARESAAAYYRLIDPLITNAQLGELANFLGNDHFNMGVTPANHLRRLHLNLYNSDVYLLDGTLTTFEYGSQATQHVHDWLRSLLLIKKKMGFKLTVSATWQNFIRPSSDAFARTLVPLLLEMRNEGASITVRVWDAPYVKTHDISDFLDLPQQDWCETWDEKMRELRRLG